MVKELDLGDGQTYYEDKRGCIWKTSYEAEGIRTPESKPINENFNIPLPAPLRIVRTVKTTVTERYVY